MSSTETSHSNFWREVQSLGYSLTQGHILGTGQSSQLHSQFLGKQFFFFITLTKFTICFVSKGIWVTYNHYSMIRQRIMPSITKEWKINFKKYKRQRWLGIEPGFNRLEVFSNWSIQQLTSNPALAHISVWCHNFFITPKLNMGFKVNHHIIQLHSLEYI